MTGHEFEERSFDAKEQAEIVRLAARMQADQADRMDTGQIERIAEEAGIDSQFVRAAADEVIARRGSIRVQKPKPPKESSPGDFFVGLFVLIQSAAIFNLMHVFAPGIGGSPLTGCAIVAALLMGVAMARRSGPGSPLQNVFGSAVFLTCVIGLFVRVYHGNVDSAWWPQLPQMVLLEFLAAMIGAYIGRFATDSHRKQPAE
jgi:hypothetical protein